MTSMPPQCTFGLTWTLPKKIPYRLFYAIQLHLKLEHFNLLRPKPKIKRIRRRSVNKSPQTILFLI